MASTLSYAARCRRRLAGAYFAAELEGGKDELVGIWAVGGRTAGRYQWVINEAVSIIITRSVMRYVFSAKYAVTAKGLQMPLLENGDVAMNVFMASREKDLNYWHAS